MIVVDAPVYAAGLSILFKLRTPDDRTSTALFANEGHEIVAPRGCSGVPFLCGQCLRCVFGLQNRMKVGRRICHTAMEPVASDVELRAVFVLESYQFFKIQTGQGSFVTNPVVDNLLEIVPGAGVEWRGVGKISRADSVSRSSCDEGLSLWGLLLVPARVFIIVISCVSSAVLLLLLFFLFGYVRCG